MRRAGFEVELAARVIAFYETLGTGYRRAVKRALKQLAAGKGDTHPLHDALEGYHRLRVGPYRIIYRHEAPRRILCDHMGPEASSANFSRPKSSGD